MATRKQPPRKKEEQFKSPFEPIEEVAKAAEECRRLIAQGIITLELRYPVEVQFRIDEEKYKTLGKSEAEDKRFREILGDEITKGLISALTDDIFDSFPPPHILDVPRRALPTYKAEAEAIKEKVGEILCDDEVRSWYKIKTTSKTAVLQSVDWEINLRKAQRKSGVLENIPHALVRFGVHEPKVPHPSPFRFLFFPPVSSAEGDEYFTIDVHEQDIRNLIADLTRLLHSIEALRS